MSVHFRTCVCRIGQPPLWQQEASHRDVFLVVLAETTVFSADEDVETIKRKTALR